MPAPAALPDYIIDNIASPISGGLLGGARIIPAQGWGTASKLFGVRDDVIADVAVFEAYLGASVSYSMAFANGGANWAALQAGAVTEAGRGTTRPVYWSIGLPAGITLTQVANGSQDAQFVTLANLFLSTRPSDTIIPVRIFWEFQNIAFAWYAPGNEALYIAAFRRVTQVLLNVSTKFRFDWCPNYTTTILGTPYDPALAYPGDSYVDVIGQDVYWINAFDTTNPVTALRAKFNGTYGLNWLTSFARTHNKPISLPEWGVNTNDGQQYISGLAEWLREQNLAYNNYYDVNGSANFQDRLSLDQYPTTGTRFKTEFGPAIPANLLTFPKTFANAAWSKGNSTITAGQPDVAGGTTAEAMFEAATTNIHDVFRTYTKPAATGTYRITWVAKPINRNWARIQIFQNAFADGTSCYFDLVGGVEGGFFQYGGMGTPVPFSYLLENGWMQFGYDFTATAATDLIIQLQAATADGTDSYLGDITKGLYSGGAWLRKVA